MVRRMPGAQPDLAGTWDPMVAHPTGRLSSANSAPEEISCVAVAVARLKRCDRTADTQPPWTEPSFAVT